MNTLTREIDLIDIEKEYRGEREDVKERFVSGASQLERQVFRPAADEYQKVLEIDPRSVGGLINFGNALFGLDKPDEALKYYRRALRLDPGNRIARKNISLVLLNTSRLQHALQVLSGLLQQDPSDADVHGLFGLYYLQLRDNRCAGSLEEAVRLGTRKAGFFIDLVYYYEDIEEDYAKAIQVAERALAVLANPPPLLLNDYAYALIKGGVPEKGLSILHRIPAERGSRYYPLVLATEGLYYLTANNLEGNKYYTRAKHAASDDNLKRLLNQRHLYELGQYYFRTGDVADAKRRWLEALKVRVSPKPPEVSQKILRALQKLVDSERINGTVAEPIQITASPRGLGVEIDLSHLFIFLDSLIHQSRARRAKVSYKDNERYVTKSTIAKKGLEFLFHIKHQLLEPSFMLELDGLSLYSGGYGCFFLETSSIETERIKRLAVTLLERVNQNGGRGIEAHPQWQSGSKL